MISGQFVSSMGIKIDIEINPIFIPPKELARILKREKLFRNRMDPLLYAA